MVLKFYLKIAVSRKTSLEAFERVTRRSSQVVQLKTSNYRTSFFLETFHAWLIRTQICFKGHVTFKNVYILQRMKERNKIYMPDNTKNKHKLNAIMYLTTAAYPAFSYSTNLRYILQRWPHQTHLMQHCCFTMFFN